VLTSYLLWNRKIACEKEEDQWLLKHRLVFFPLSSCIAAFAENYQKHYVYQTNFTSIDSRGHSLLI
jgi:hypothetical protein